MQVTQLPGIPLAYRLLNNSTTGAEVFFSGYGVVSGTETKRAAPQREAAHSLELLRALVNQLQAC